MPSRELSAFLGFLLVLGFSFAWNGTGGYCDCNSCADCTNALNNNANCSLEVRLTADIIDAGATCINDPVNFTGKTFDCQGNLIDGSGSGRGIYLHLQNGNVIRNCQVRQFVDGIRIYGNNNVFINNTAHGNTNDGAYMSGSNNNTFFLCNFSGNNQRGVSSDSSPDNNIVNSTVSNNIGDGIRLWGDRNSIINSTVNGNGGGGIMLSGYTCTVINNTVCYNTGHGVFLFYDSHTVRDNTFCTNGGSGLYLFSGSHSNITGNSMPGNTQAAFMMSSAPTLHCPGAFTGNTGNGGRQILFSTGAPSWSDMEADEIVLCGASGAYMRNVTVYGPASPGHAVFFIHTTDSQMLDSEFPAGIYLYESSGNLLSNITISGGYGVEVIRSDDNTISNSAFDGNAFGINFSNSDHNTVSGTSVEGGPSDGISLVESDNNIFANDTISGNGMDGLYIYRSLSNTVYNTTLSGNGRNGLEMVYSSYNSLNNCSTVGNGQNGILINDPPSPPDPHSHNVFSEVVSCGNSGSGFALLFADNELIANSTACLNGEKGIYSYNGTENTFSNNSLYGNGHDFHAYNSSYAMETSRFLNPAGTVENHTALSIIDAQEGGEEYSIDWASNSNELPSGTASFLGKWVEISAIAGSPIIDSITWSWEDSELGGYDDSLFGIWEYELAWLEIPSTLNTGSNTLRVSGLVPASLYGILQSSKSEEKDGGEGETPECLSDSECGPCEYCSIANGECLRRSESQCIDDSGCSMLGGGYTCPECSCIPPECTVDSGCPPGHTCEDYECIPPECTSASDCTGAGERCVNYECVPPECTRDSDCPEDEICADYECRGRGGGEEEEGGEPGGHGGAPVEQPPQEEKPPLITPVEIGEEIIPLVEPSEEERQGEWGIWQTVTTAAAFATALLVLGALIYFLNSKKKKRKWKEEDG